jgi:hypothetical protein
MWLYCSDSWGMGMGLGLLATSLFTKAIFAPSIIYSVSRESSHTFGIVVNDRCQDEASVTRSRGDDG